MRAVRGADAVITVGAGDKMFWGRIAAHLTHVPVLLAALHSTGWPDGVGRLNRLLTGWTDGFIAVAAQHGRFLVEHEKFPADKVHVIPNGVDTKRFAFCPEAPAKLRRELGVPDDTPLCGIVAALRAEKNHRLFLQVAAAVHRQLPKVHFVIVGDGPQRAAIQADVARLQLDGGVHLLGTRNDVPQILSALNVFLLTSDNEANPVSILEALSVQVPVVAPNVGSIRETVQDGVTGFLVPPSEAEPMVRRVLQVLGDPALARNLGAAGRRLVERDWSLERMVSGYERLIVDLYRRRQGPPGRVQRAADRATSGRLATAVAPGQA